MRFAIMTAVIAVSAVTAAQAGNDFQGKIERSFPARDGGKIVVTTERGNIDLTSWDRGEVSVVMTIGVSGVSDEDATKLIERFAVDMRGDNGDVAVEVSYDKPLRPLRRQPSVRLTIQVPKRYNADLTTAGGDIALSSIEGTAEVRTSGGDVAVRQVSAGVRAITSGGDLMIVGIGGDVEARTSGGDVTVRDATGSVQAATSGGDIEVTGVGGEVEGRTSGGDVTVLGAKGSVVAITSGGDVTIAYDVSQLPLTEARTSGGDVTVSVLENASARIDASTSSGSVECELPVSVLGKLARGRLEGTLGGGGNVLTLRSAGGSIRLLKK